MTEDPCPLGRLRKTRQFQEKRAPLPGGALHPHPAAVGLDDLADQGQAETGSGLPLPSATATETIKYLLLLFGRDPRSLVTYPKKSLGTIHPCPKDYSAPCGGILDRILQEVFHRLPKLHLLGENRRQVRGAFDVNPMPNQV
jgi:hypothetical protein